MSREQTHLALFQFTTFRFFRPRRRIFKILYRNCRRRRRSVKKGQNIRRRRRILKNSLKGIFAAGGGPKSGLANAVLSIQIHILARRR